MHKEETIKSDLVYKGRILSLYVDEISLPNGKESIREVVEHKDGAAILALKDNCFIFVRQYRYAVGEDVLEIPAGLIETGESAEETAIRELQEEVGLKPVKLLHLLDMLPSPGFTDEKTTIYFADSFEEHALKPDDDEFIKIERIPVEQAKELYSGGAFHDAKTVSALGYYFSLLESKK